MAQAELARDLSVHQQILKRRPELEAQNGTISKAYEALSPSELGSWMRAHVALSKNVLDNPDAILRKVVGDNQVHDMLSMQRGGKPVEQTRIGGSVGELFGEVMRALFSTIGSYIIGLTVVGLILIGRAAF